MYGWALGTALLLKAMRIVLDGGYWVGRDSVPDLLLVMLVAVALLRGSMFGAIGGFFAGLLVDTASLGTLGLTSLVLTIAGYWIGRYGETTGRDRAHVTTKKNSPRLQCRPDFTLPPVEAAHERISKSRV